MLPRMFSGLSADELGSDVHGYKFAMFQLRFPVLAVLAEVSNTGANTVTSEGW